MRCFPSWKLRSRDSSPKYDCVGCSSVLSSVEVFHVVDVVFMFYALSHRGATEDRCFFYRFRLTHFPHSPNMFTCSICICLPIMYIWSPPIWELGVVKCVCLDYYIAKGATTDKQWCSLIPKHTRGQCSFNLGTTSTHHAASLCLYCRVVVYCVIECVKNARARYPLYDQLSLVCHSVSGM